MILGHKDPIPLLSQQYVKVYETINLEPVLPLAKVDTYFITQTAIMTLLVLLTLLYPIMFIKRLEDF